MHATAKELRFRSKELLEAVARGEEVTITYRGKPRAKLVPVNPGTRKEQGEEDPVFGMWKDNEKAKDVEEYVHKLRRGRF